jgi:hypothetical protein
VTGSETRAPGRTARTCSATTASPIISVPDVQRKPIAPTETGGSNAVAEAINGSIAHSVSGVIVALLRSRAA